MFERAGHLVFRLRFAIVVGWLALGGLALAFAPNLAEVGSADQSTFLPADAESTAAREALQAAFPDEAAEGTATLVFGRSDGLTDADRTYIADTAAWLLQQAPDPVTSAVTGVIDAASSPELASRLRSEDGTLELLQVELSVGAFDQEAAPVVEAIREHLAATLPDGLTGNLTGSVGIGADYLSSILEATDRTTIVTIALVILVLLAIYRAPLAALVPLVTIGAAYLVSKGLLGYLAQAGWQISSLLGTFVVVLVFGVGTDYTIFLISRFREEVRGSEWAPAVGRTVGRIGSVITASAATVAIGLGAMVVGRFVMFQTTGPALAIAILVTLAAGLTLAPALLAIFGHYLFWPLHESGVDRSGRGFFGRLAALIGRRPLVVATVVLVALAVPALATPGLRQTFDVLADLPADSDAKAGFDLVAERFGKGRLMPVEVVIDGGAGAELDGPAALGALRETTDRLLATDGVLRVESLVAPSGDGTTPDALRPSVQLGEMADGFALPTDPVAGLRKLLDPATSTGLRAGARYVDALGTAYPDLAGTADLEAARRDLDRMPNAIGDLRELLQVGGQLERIAVGVGQAVEAGLSASSWADPIRAYLGELVVAYPKLAAHPAFVEAQAILATPEPTAGPVVADLLALAQVFAGQPDAIFVPTGFADPETAAIQAEIAGLGARLPGELRSLSAAFATRLDDYFLPTTLEAEDQAAIDQLRAEFVAVDGSLTRVFATMRDDPYSAPAFDTVRRIRAAVAEDATAYGSATRILVGGQTALEVDLQGTINDDFVRVAGLTVLGVLVVLILLLRSVVAPLYLVGTVLLSYLCTLGLTSVFFQDVLGQPGMNYFLPLMVFVLLVALGSDYNIFLMSRVREEADRHGTRDGIRIGSSRTGAVITSAGIILAGTFLAMVASPLTVLFQVGVIVAVGVLIDTFVVRSLLVPAITTLLGDAAWWPFGRRGGTAGKPSTPPGPGIVTPRPPSGPAPQPR